MEIDFIQELKKRDELLDGYLRQIEIQEEFIQKQKELIEYLEIISQRSQISSAVFSRTVPEENVCLILMIISLSCVG